MTCSPEGAMAKIAEQRAWGGVMGRIIKSTKWGLLRVTSSTCMWAKKFVQGTTVKKSPQSLSRNSKH